MMRRIRSSRPRQGSAAIVRARTGSSPRRGATRWPSADSPRDRPPQQARSLPVDTQRLLLLAAADSTADTAFLLRAASILGVKTEAAAAAEAAGPVVLGSTGAFRPPPIPSGVSGGARPADRRAAHKALAAATDSEDDIDRQAWHLAA